MTYSNEEIGLQANAYARAFIDTCSTSVSFNQYNLATQFDIQNQITAMRKEVSDASKSSPQISLSLDKSVDDFYASTYFSKQQRSGNCSEYSDLALEHIAEHHPTTHAEVFHIEGGDHVFLVLGRDKNSNPSNPKTWGKNAVFCDPWANKVYPASDYQKNLQNFTSGREMDPATKRIQHSYESFNPDKHKLALSKARQFQSGDLNQSAERRANVITFFQHKAAAAEQALTTFEADLKATAQQLESRYGENDKKLKAVQEKIKSVQTEMNSLRHDVSQKTLTEQDYFKVKSQLENRLQRSIAATQFTPEEQKTLGTHRSEKREFLRPILGGAKTQGDVKKAAEKVQKTMAEADASFRKKQATAKKTQQKLKAAQAKHIPVAVPINLTAMGETKTNGFNPPVPSTPPIAPEKNNHSNTAPTPFRTKPKKPTEI